MDFPHIFAVFVSLLPAGVETIRFLLDLMDTGTFAMIRAIVAELWRRYDAGRQTRKGRSPSE